MLYFSLAIDKCIEIWYNAPEEVYPYGEDGEYMGFFGRKVIYSDEREITRENVANILLQVGADHAYNANQISYLYDYYRGNQPILSRVKDVRPEINNMVVENRANEIVSFKTGYLMGDPVQYVSRSDDERVSSEVSKLNEFVFYEDKAPKDKELADWFHICGTAYRMVLPRTDDDEDESPFRIFTLDPRNAFVVYSSDVEKKPLMGVKIVNQVNGTPIFTVYTDTMRYDLQDGIIIHEEEHTLGGIPIIEYPANQARLGAFEIVLPLLDAINEIDSDSVDGVDQFIQALLVFMGMDIEDDEIKKLKDYGAIRIPKDTDIKYLVQELNQGQTQELKNSMYSAVLTICGIPNRNGGSSTSDTGSAVIMRDGWSAANERAKDSEMYFKKSEKAFLKMALRIMNLREQTSLKVTELDIRFTRRNYEDILSKTQVLTTLLASNMVHPKLAFQHCGLFVDPELAYQESMKYAEEKRKETEKELMREDEDGEEVTVEESV